MATKLTQERLRDLLSYSPETGEFRHILRRRGVRVGSLAGTISNTDGLRYIGVDGRHHAAQRLAWLYVKGEWPDAEVGFLNGALPSPLRERFDNLAMTVVGDLTAVELRAILNYDPETGIFTYRSPRRGVTVGKRAGSVDPNGYRYIGVRGKSFTAQRLAWVHYYGEWPDGHVRFRNENRDDCRIENLYRPLGEHRIPELRRAKERADRQARPMRHRGYNLKKDFGISLEDYQRLFVAQGGVCAICGQPELSKRNGKAKWLAVDHDHLTGAVRGLLCGNCNPMIGYAKDIPARLRAAADYLDARARPDNIVPLKKDAC